MPEPASSGQRLCRQAPCPRCAGNLGRGDHGADCQAQCIAQARCDTQALGGRAQLRLVGEKQATVEKLRAMAQHQLAVHSPGFPGDATQEIVNTFLVLAES